MALMGGAIVVRMGSLTCVQPARGRSYWLDEVTGYIGRQTRTGVTWLRPTAPGARRHWEVVAVKGVTPEMSKVIEALLVLAA